MLEEEEVDQLADSFSACMDLTRLLAASWERDLGAEDAACVAERADLGFLRKVFVAQILDEEYAPSNEHEISVVAAMEECGLEMSEVSASEGSDAPSSSKVPAMSVCTQCPAQISQADGRRAAR